jgi:DNA recombination protein RmuC
VQYPWAFRTIFARKGARILRYGVPDRRVGGSCTPSIYSANPSDILPKHSSVTSAPQFAFIYLIAALIAGAALGALFAWWFAKARAAVAAAQLAAASQSEQARLSERLLAAEAKLKQLSESLQTLERVAQEANTALNKSNTDNAQLSERASRVPVLQQDYAALTQAFESLQSQYNRIATELAQTQTTLAAERSQTVEKLALLDEAKAQLSNQFKALASDILEEKSKRFTEQNQANLGLLLDPLRTRLSEFQNKVEEVYVQEGKDRASLAEQVRNLMDLNQKMSQEANNLTRALKGQAKSQGNWGEMILERVLEASGLSKGREYETQALYQQEDGSQGQPDVVIHLPENKHLVIDAKVSLVAYDEYVNSDDDAVRAQALKSHIESVRRHMNGLSPKSYQTLLKLNSIDFVIMFVPIEPAFMLAIERDAQLWQDGWKSNILLVSPSTLLFVLRTVQHLWRQADQTTNAQAIAARGAQLYDRLAGFVEELNSVGKNLDQARNSFGEAYKKLSTGNGNVLRQAELLRELGVKPKKQLPLADESRDLPLLGARDDAVDA